MKSLSTLVFFLMYSLSNSQSHRFIYEYKFASDSTKINSVTTEIMRLDIFTDHSEFVSEIRAKRDSSIFNIKQRNSNSMGNNLPIGKMKMKIYKGHKKYSIESIGIEQFKIPYDQKLNWILTPDTKIVSSYNCQKATVIFGGRKWNAWFTSEIPYQDGPYIFGNLPGMIISIEDEENQHSFLLLANYKVKNSSPNVSFTTRVKDLSITKDQFNKKWTSFRKKPIGFREQYLIVNPNIFNPTYYDDDGNIQNKIKLYAEDRIQIKMEIASNNNFIDLDLYR